MTDFYVGQKVVCIAKGTWERTKRNHPGTNVPVSGNIYTIREVYVDPFDGLIGVRLKEVINPPIIHHGGKIYYIEFGWPQEEFRPLEEKKTDISIFKKLLNPSKVHENS